MKLPLTTCRTMLGARNVRVDLLAILFGVGSWIGVNSVYLQLPLFVAHAPEGWSLPSFLVIVIQIGNVGPLIYTLVQRWSPRKPNDSHLIHGIYVVGAVAAICMATMYQMTALVAGEMRSVALLAVTFFLAFIGCTSSVLFMPYMGRFKEIYLITYLVGEGLSGLVPSLLALAQGVGGNTECRPDAATGALVAYTPLPRFESDVFFYCIFALMVVSGVAFVLLDRLRMCRREYASVTIRHGNDYMYDETTMPVKSLPHVEGVDDMDLDKGTTTTVAEQGAVDAISTTVRRDDGELSAKRLSTGNYVLLMVVMAVVSLFGSGIYPSVQSYSCLPYGNLAYHLAVTLGSIANPMSCFLAVFLPHKSIRHIVALCVLMTVLTAYALATAVLSPMPPLVNTLIGDILVVRPTCILCVQTISHRIFVHARTQVITWIVLTGLVSYIKLSITSIFRYQGGQSLVWIGAVSQAGSTVGAVISFCLVNLTDIFETYEEC